MTNVFNAMASIDSSLSGKNTHVNVIQKVSICSINPTSNVVLYLQQRIVRYFQGKGKCTPDT